MRCGTGVHEPVRNDVVWHHVCRVSFYEWLEFRELSLMIVVEDWSQRRRSSCIRASVCWLLIEWASICKLGQPVGHWALSGPHLWGSLVIEVRARVVVASSSVAVASAITPIIVGVVPCLLVSAWLSVVAFVSSSQARGGGRCVLVNR